MSLPPDPSASCPPSTLQELLEAKLAESGLEPDVRQTVLDAFPTAPIASAGSSPGIPEPAYLSSVTVQGFRGIGGKATLRLEPRPGLTVVTGHNGSGKSSFAEAVETAFTGDNSRWKISESKTWRDSWRNLHHSQAPTVEVEFVDSGPGLSRKLTRTWHGPDADDSSATVTSPGQRPLPLDRLGWDRALELYRPFLSYSELGRTVTGKPVNMHDAVFKVLGLGAVTDADARLRKQEREYTTALTNVKDAIPGLVRVLLEMDDPRASAALQALEGGRSPDLPELRRLLSTQEPPGEGELAQLRRLADLHGPDLDRVASAVSRLREAIEAARAVAGTSAEVAHQRAELLEQALALHRAHPGERHCPVCGTRERLTTDWAEQAAQQATMLRTESERVTRAHRELTNATAEAHRLVQGTPGWLPESLAALWRKWTDCCSLASPEELADSMERTASTLAEACRKARQEATTQLAAADARWLDAATQLGQWLSDAEKAEAGRKPLRRIKKARAWLKKVHGDLKNERLHPIVERIQEMWRELREESSVVLESIELKGSANQRRLNLDVTVDGIEAPALGVMSQGELNSLALSLFLPRATNRESPFRFLLLDDPIQAMDPAKVSGLARLLSKLAEDWQIIVFTHDTRLSDELRFQRLPATFREVSRGQQSKVTVTIKADPVTSALRAARNLSKGVSARIRSAVLPGLCRQVLEAACKDAARHRMLAQGKSLNEIAASFEKAEQLTQLAALALFDRPPARDSGESVYSWFDQHHPAGIPTLKVCAKGAHEHVEIDNPSKFIRDIEDIARLIREAGEKAGGKQ